jgi:hypothetical protein
MSKGFVMLILVFLVGASITAAAYAFSDSIPIPKPSVPQFSIYLVNHPYEVPPTTPTYTTDPYTGQQNEVTYGGPGYHVDNVSIELWILNEQPSYSYGSTICTPYYDVRTKGHFEQDWNELYGTFGGLHSANENDTGTFIPNGSPAQSNRRYTVLTFSAVRSPDNVYPTVTYPPDAQIDFQVSAMIGHPSEMFYDDHPFVPMLIGHQEPAIGFDAQSDWSSTQTITIPVDLVNNSITDTPYNPIVSASEPIVIPTPTPSPTQTPTATPSPSITPTPSKPNITLNQSSLAEICIAGVIVAVAAVGCVIYFRKRHR